MIIDVDDVSPSAIEPKLVVGDMLPIKRRLVGLFRTLQDYLDKGIELERLCRVAVLLSQSGVDSNNSVFNKIARRCLSEQKNDGGWVGVEDSVWCVAFLREFDECHSAYEKGLVWLEEQKLECGGWGKTNRDAGRIPITGTLLYFLPELSTLESCKWLEDEWRREFRLQPRLTYKCALALMGLQRNGYQFTESELLDNSVQWLVSQQNEDYGFGPWKGHSVGSDIWCTGVSVIALLQYPDKVPECVIRNSLKWLVEKQLPNGLWPGHYVDEGSSWALYALTRGYSHLGDKS